MLIIVQEKFRKMTEKKSARADFYVEKAYEKAVFLFYFESCEDRWCDWEILLFS